MDKLEQTATTPNIEELVDKFSDCFEYRKDAHYVHVNEVNSFKAVTDERDMSDFFTAYRHHIGQHENTFERHLNEDNLNVITLHAFSLLVPRVTELVPSSSQLAELGLEMKSWRERVSLWRSSMASFQREISPGMVVVEDPTKKY